MAFAVWISVRAERDFDRIVEWLAERSLSGARSLQQEFEARTRDALRDALSPH